MATAGKIVASSLCHTEMFHLFEGKDKRGFPTVLGHEGAGVVESVGPGVTDFKPGDKVIPVSVAHCGECRFCKSPKTNLCERSWINDHVDLMSYPTTCFTCRGQPILQFTSTGTFSEYIVINQIYVVKIHDDAPLDRVCLLGCGIPTGYGAAVNTAGVTPGSVCAVFGLGAVGLAAVMGCKNAGASRIFAVDINEQKFEKAKLFGATDFLNPKAYDKPISEVLAELTNGGVDFSIECVGNPEVMRAALESCIKGWGVSVLVGYTDVDFSARPIQLISGKTWKGTLLGGYKIKDSLPKLVNDYMTGKIMVDEFITHKMDLEQINDAINLMKTGQCIRCILNISK
uniref:Alcohol dehydrogenase 8b n=1 Tax=Cyprinus carpio carpio TaxID=630221 RepID=A0A9J7ZDZ6_CYPCA